MTKQKFKEKKEIINIYRAKQMDTFQSLDTYPNQWDMLKIESIDRNGNIIYEKLPDYTRIYPYYEWYLKETKSKESELSDMVKNELKYSRCQLCGHVIMYHYFIKCPDKKLIMHVGSTCINEFKGADYVYRTVKQFESTQLQIMFSKWINYAIDICNNKKVEGSYYYIQPEYYDFRKKLIKIRSEGIETISDIKIKNIFKKATELNIPIDDQQINIQKENKQKELKNKVEQLKTNAKKVIELGYKLYLNPNNRRMLFLEYPNGDPVESLNFNEIAELKQYDVKYNYKHSQYVIYTNLEND